MTIFGFNTDVKLADVVYHVQSEARQNDLLLQTMVFVKGQCVGKQAFSYAHEISHPGFSTEAMHEISRSEEHTSELQSRQYLVCRLLLEKKKNKDKEHKVLSIDENCVFLLQ